MRRYLQIGLLAIGVLWVLSATGNAQVSRHYLVNVPFDFTVGNKLIKSGEYTIEPLSGTTNQRSLVLRSRSEGKARLIGQVAINSSESSEEGRATFAKYGGEWVLQEIVTPGFELKLKSSRSAERDLGKVTETRSVAISR